MTDRTLDLATYDPWACPSPYDPSAALYEIIEPRPLDTLQFSPPNPKSTNRRTVLTSVVLALTLFVGAVVGVVLDKSMAKSPMTVDKLAVSYVNSLHQLNVVWSKFSDTESKNSSLSDLKTAAAELKNADFQFSREVRDVFTSDSVHSDFPEVAASGKVVADQAVWDCSYLEKMMYASSSAEYWRISREWAAKGDTAPGRKLKALLHLPDTY